MLPLSHTPNKIAIRQNWDKPIISDFSMNIGKKLDYFGLPGSDIADLIDWKDYLHWRTGVEFIPANGNTTEEQRRRISQLQTNIMLNRLSSNWELRRGCLEDIVITGADVDGNRPAKMPFDKNTLLGMHYDLHNWDFQGGFGYKTGKSDSKRIKAIETCIHLQKSYPSPFLFLMTFNVRHTLGNEIDRYLLDQEKEIHSANHKEMLTWYSERGSKESTEHYRLKAVVTLYIRRVAEMQSFDCYCYPPIYYEGWKEHLLHFVFRLIPQRTVLPCFSTQRLVDVIELPLLEMKNGNLLIPTKQHPHFDRSNVLQVFDGLGITSI